MWAQPLVPKAYLGTARACVFPLNMHFDLKSEGISTLFLRHLREFLLVPLTILKSTEAHLEVSTLLHYYHRPSI